jgi:hypothetical protein
MTNDKDSAVTQADRDAAAAIACLPHQDKLRSGEWDSDPVIQALAKHRIAASQTTQTDALKIAREALESAPLVDHWQSKADFGVRQDDWLKTKYRAALEALKETT